MQRDMLMSKLNARRFKPLQQTWQDYLQRFFPCYLCQSDFSQYAGLCEDCWQSLPWALTEIEREGLTIQIACYYQYPLNQMILAYKYHQQLFYKTLFTQLLLQAKLPKVQAVIAMPISQQRLVKRGFNQSLILAQGVARCLNVPVWQPVVRLDARHQKGLSRAERLENIQEQFQLVAQKHPKYRHVLIIDDVVTTGGSLLALTQALSPLAIEKISYLCVAGA